jgi:hypothetical protein
MSWKCAIADFDYGDLLGFQLTEKRPDGSRGIRPAGAEDFRRQNDAQGKHLSDMRAIVAKKLGVPELLIK